MPTTSNEGTRKISATSAPAKKFLPQLVGMKVGDKLELAGFMEGFGQPVIAHCVEIEPGKFWQFSLFWNGVHLQEVVAELQNDSKDLVLEACGA